MRASFVPKTGHCTCTVMYFLYFSFNQKKILIMKKLKALLIFRMIDNRQHSKTAQGYLAKFLRDSIYCFPAKSIIKKI